MDNAATSDRDPAPAEDGAREDQQRKADRPGGPGQSAMNPVRPGQAAPTPDDDDVVEDDVIEQRRERLDRRAD